MSQPSRPTLVFLSTSAAVTTIDTRVRLYEGVLAMTACVNYCLGLFILVAVAVLVNRGIGRSL